MTTVDTVVNMDDFRDCYPGTLANCAHLFGSHIPVGGLEAGCGAQPRS